MNDNERAQLQQRIADAIRDSHPAFASALIRRATPDDPCTATMLAALSAAAHDDAIWDALAQVQVVVLGRADR